MMTTSRRRTRRRRLRGLWTKLNIEFYKDASDAVFKSLVE